MRTAVVLWSVCALVAGCAGIQSLVGVAEIRPLGSGMHLMLPADNPSGPYVVETRQGLPVARGVYAGARPGQPVAVVGGRAHLPINVDVRRYPEARGCLRIRRPDGQLLGIGMSGQTEFQLPALEASYIQSVELPELQLAERDYARNQRIVSATQQWLATNPPELAPNRSCRVPVASEAACQSESSALQAAQKPCFHSNFSCSMVGASLDDLVSQLGEDKRSAATMANHLGSGLCSLAVDAHHGQNFDLLSYLRSIGVTLAVDTLYRGLINENPGMNERYALAATAGIINYGLCLRDAATQCREQNVRWERYARSQHRQCVERLSYYQKASDLLERYGSPASIQQAQQQRHARLRELNQRSLLQSTPAVQQVRPC